MTGLNHWIYTLLIFTAGFISGNEIVYEVDGIGVWFILTGTILFLIKLFLEFIYDRNES